MHDSPQLNPEILNTLETKRLVLKQINQMEFYKSDNELHQKFEGYTIQSFFSPVDPKNTLIFSITHKVNEQLLGLIFLKHLIFSIQGRRFRNRGS